MEEMATAGDLHDDIGNIFATVASGINSGRNVKPENKEYSATPLISMFPSFRSSAVEILAAGIFMHRSRLPLAHVEPLAPVLDT